MMGDDELLSVLLAFSSHGKPMTIIEVVRETLEEGEDSTPEYRKQVSDRVKKAVSRGLVTFIFTSQRRQYQLTPKGRERLEQLFAS